MPDQSYTDFEKTLKYLSEKYNIIHVYGAGGCEMDHAIGNLAIAKKFITTIDLTFFDEYQTYFLVSKSITLENIKNKTVSIVPFPKVTGLTYSGLQYDLKNATLILGETICGTRNKAIANKVSIEFATGVIAVFYAN